MALATFAACDALAGDGGGGGALRPSVAFPALALFNVLRLPMATLPSVRRRRETSLRSLRRRRLSRATIRWGSRL